MRNHILLLIFAVFTGILFISCRGDHEVVEDVDKPKISSDQLTQTAFVSNMREKFEADKNTIYCSTFQLAWNKFKEYADGNITFTEKMEEADNLNTSPFKESYLAQNAYIAEIGKAADGIEAKINNLLKQKFPKLNHTYKFNTPGGEKGDAIVSYAFLYKNLQFAKEFEKLEEGMSFYQTSDKMIKVKGFGFNKFNDDKHAKLRKQVKILRLEDKTAIIKLISKSADDELILAMIEPEKDLISTYQKVAKIEENADVEDMRYIKYLRIPVVDFNITHSYKQFLNKHFTNPKLAGYYIAEARQDIKFKLNEKGAVLKSESEIVALKSEPVAVQGVEFNRPFFVIMRKKGANLPYFLCWIANPEILKTK